MSNERRAAVVSRDKKYVWHPYTPMEQYRRDGQPLVIDRAEGSRLYDLDGRSIIDGNSSWWTALLGHNHPRLVAALRQQSERLSHTSLAGVTHEPAVDFAEAVIARAPSGLEHVFFSDNGSTSVEAAIKMAIQVQRQLGRSDKTKLLSLEHAFHGETMGVTAVSGVEAFRAPFVGMLMPVVHLPSPADGEQRALEALSRVLQEQAGQVAALVVEPLIQGAGGMLMYSASFLKEARRLTEQHDVLLIVDEVFTGYGRAGTFWACEQAGICPDILCSAKGLSGGMLPFAATLTTPQVFEAFLGDSSRAFYYGHTYCGNPLGAAVAREVLRIYEDEDIVGNLAPKVEKIAACFSRLGELPGVQNARSTGMCAALELAGQSGYLQTSGWQVYEKALAQGAYVRPLGNVVYIAPPLNISMGDLDELLSVVERSVAPVAKTLQES